METKVLADLERYQPDKHVLVPVVSGERTKVVLLCLAPGTQAPPHTHVGFEVTLQPLVGRGVLPMADGAELALLPGRVHLVDGAISFNPRNPYDEPFQMLIHLVRK